VPVLVQVQLEAFVVQMVKLSVAAVAARAEHYLL